MKYVILWLLIGWCGITQAIVPPDRKKRLEFRPEHEFYLGFGNTPLPADDEEGDFNFDLSHRIHFDGDTYRGKKYTSGVYFGGYSYRVKRWLNIGVSASYTAYHRNFYRYYTDRKAGKECSRYLGIVPALRFTWLDRSWVRMYSGLGWGVTFKWGKNTRPDSEYKKFKCLDTPQVTILGISVGRTWFMFAEGAVSDHGSFALGVGYHLFSKQNKK